LTDSNETKQHIREKFKLANVLARCDLRQRLQLKRVLRATASHSSGALLRGAQQHFTFFTMTLSAWKAHLESDYLDPATYLASVNPGTPSCGTSRGCTMILCQ